MDINDHNYFSLFSLTESFDIDQSFLKTQYRNLQNKFHPDKFVNAGDKERLHALQMASLVNEAFDTLKSPVTRIAYIIQERGIDPETNIQAHLGEKFLLGQMELRDELEDILEQENLDKLDALKKRVLEQKNSYISDAQKLYINDQITDLKPIYNKLQFVDKLLQEIDSAEEKLLDY